ncbi:MAG: hypothetical protein DWQ28_00335 [Proteobacteria bacterium]|nr:MAG: hypothetical protein DWQ28_00335 [Pseudomonadota bacterium]
MAASQGTQEPDFEEKRRAAGIVLVQAEPAINECMKARRNADGERMTEAQKQQLKRRRTKLCHME